MYIPYVYTHIIYKFIYTCIYPHIHTHTYIHIHMYTYMQIRMYSRRNERKKDYMYKWCEYIYIHINDKCRSIQGALNVGICVSTHLYVQFYIYYT